MEGGGLRREAWLFPKAIKRRALHCMARVEAWLGGAKPARCSRLSPARASALPDWVGPHFGGGAKEYPARVRILLRFSRAGFHFSPPPHLLNDLVNYSQFGGQRAKEPPPPKKTPIPSLTAPGSTLKCCIQANHCARDFRRNPDAPARPSGAKKKVQFDWPGVRRTRSSSHAQRQFRLTELSQEAGSGAKPWRRWLGLGRGGEGRGTNSPSIPRRETEHAALLLLLPYPKDEVEAEEKVFDALGASFDGHLGERRAAASISSGRGGGGWNKLGKSFSRVHHAQAEPFLLLCHSLIRCSA